MSHFFLAFRIAFRYFFSRKRVYAVQFVSWISSGAVAVVVTAMICVLSVFNGYEKILLNQLKAFDPPLVIEKDGGKVFSPKDTLLQKVLQESPFIVAYSSILRTQGLVKVEDKELIAFLCGVDHCYTKVNDLAEVCWGKEDFIAEGNRCSMGIDLHRKLFEYADLEEDECTIYLPKRGRLLNPFLPMLSFKSIKERVAAITQVQEEKYDRTLFLDLKELQKLLNYQDDEVDRILILPQQGEEEHLEEILQERLGSEWSVLNRKEQQPDLLRLIWVEKWISFVILFFILLLATFNIIGSASMLILEKKRDIKIFSFLGAPRYLQKQIFFLQGFMVALSGLVMGFLLGAVLVLIQAQFGFLSFGQGRFSMPYPVSINFVDFIILFLILLLLLFISYIPVYKLIDKSLDK